MEANYDLARSNFLLAALHQQAGSVEAESVWHEAVSKIIGGGYAFLLAGTIALTTAEPGGSPPRR